MTDDSVRKITVGDVMEHILCKPNVRLVSAYDGKTIAPEFNTKHKDYGFICDMPISTISCRVETNGFEMNGVILLRYVISLALPEIEKIAERRRNERIAARERKVARAKKTLESGLSDWDGVANDA